MIQNRDVIVTPAILGILLATSCWPGWAGSLTGVTEEQGREPTAAAEASTTRETRLPPRLRVSGTAIAPGDRRALIVVVDEQGQEVTTVLTREGDTVHGYLVTSIVRDQVSFERDGQRYTVAVGSDRPSTGTRKLPDIPYRGTRERTAEFMAPPANVEDIQEGSNLLFEKLKANPEFQRTLDALRVRALERLRAPAPNTQSQ